jgi:MoxR-like ATPase
MNAVSTPSALFDPRLGAIGDTSAYWLRQTTLRLRREIAWCWHQRGGQASNTGLPPLADSAVDSLDLVRYDQDKRRFFADDVTAKYLSEQIQAAAPPPGSAVRGSWAWVVQALELDPAAQFVLALGLAARLDSALGTVCSACLNDASRPYPTLALAQRLWDDPHAIVALGHPMHPLFRHGLLAWETASNAGVDWNQPLDMHPWVAQTLLDPTAPLPSVLCPLAILTGGLPPTAERFRNRLAVQPPDAMQVVPLISPKDADCDAWAAAFAGERGAVRVSATLEPQPRVVSALAALCWLRGVDALLPSEWFVRHDHQHANDAWFRPVLATPTRWFAPVADVAACHTIPSFALLPSFDVPALGFEQRLAILHHGLGEKANGMETALAECARRFRFQTRALQRVIRALGHEEKIDTEKLLAVCRQEVVTEAGQLAQRVQPRFAIEELVLPPTQARQIDEIRRAMNVLTEVHYGWGTARAWNEGGLAVLFSGPPGTGKTMAAEAMSRALDIPMYRIDLSQVVNKYIGETEKNLRRIFDAAEISDCILFFDEADALFGKRTEVKDAHDRFANIEISYLLERMERFKGMAILATNRKKDLDEAFMRRLRYLVDFPLPGVPERERLWRQVFPSGVDVSELDFHYLARQFTISGGHIRSIAFNACLQSAGAGHQRVSMATTLFAIKRELDKLNRPTHEELFGAYAALIREAV